MEKSESRMSQAFDAIRLHGSNPEKIFNALSLPITYIDNVKFVPGSGRNRAFSFQEKILYSPEIVAVVHFELMGHIASWNEGFAFTLLQTAFKHALTDKLIQEIEYIGIKEQAKLANPLIITDQGNGCLRVITRNEILQGEPIFGYEGKAIRINRDQVIDSESIEKRHIEEKLIFETQKEFPISIHRLIEGNLEWLEFLTDRLVSLKLKCSIKELLEKFRKNLQACKIDSGLIIENLFLPEKTEDKTDPTNKFKNEWTMNFCKKMVAECDFDYLLSEIFRYELPPLWDVMLIDKTSKKLRYIEVKVSDSLTKKQTMNIPGAFDSGMAMELCVVRPT